MICVHCGCALTNDSTSSGEHSVETVLKTISQREKTSAIIWFIIAGLQIIVGFLWDWYVFIPGALNLFFAFTRLNQSKKVLQPYPNLIKDYEKWLTPIIICIYSLRILIKQGKIPSVHIGRKTLVDYDEVIRYLKETGVFHPDKPNKDSVVNGIRKVL